MQDGGRRPNWYRTPPSTAKQGLHQVQPHRCIPSSAITYPRNEAITILLGLQRSTQAKRGMARSLVSAAVFPGLAAAGNRAIAELLHVQRKGSIELIASTNAEETAADTESMTADFAKSRAADSTPTEAEALHDLEERTRRQHRRSQHPMMASEGPRPSEIVGSRNAFYIGNDKYPEPWSPLRQAIDDAASMRRAMEAAGLRTVGMQHDRTAQEMSSGFRGALAATAPKSELLLYYAGHGTADGMIGVAPKGPKELDLVPYPTFLAELEAAAGRGAHVVGVIDACYSGKLASDMRAKVRRTAIERGTPPGDVGSPAIAVARQLLALIDMIEAAAKEANKRAWREATVPNKSAGGDRSVMVGASPPDEAVRDEMWDAQVVPVLQSLSIDLALAGISSPTISETYDRHVIEDYADLAIMLAERWRSAPPVSPGDLPAPSSDVPLSPRQRAPSP